MKLIVSPQCQIAALTYDIVVSDWVLKKMDVRASCNFKELKVRLPKDNLRVEQTFTELIHELLHIVDDTAGFEMNEGDTIIRGNLLSQALLSLGIEPDFSRIPEEEKK